MPIHRWCSRLRGQILGCATLGARVPALTHFQSRSFGMMLFLTHSFMSACSNFRGSVVLMEFRTAVGGSHVLTLALEVSGGRYQGAEMLHRRGFCSYVSFFFAFHQR